MEPSISMTNYMFLLLGPGFADNSHVHICGSPLKTQTHRIEALLLFRLLAFGSGDVLLRQDSLMMLAVSRGTPAKSQLGGSQPSGPLAF